jgi:hypothetical protein
MLECFTDKQTLLRWNRSTTQNALGEAVEGRLSVKYKLFTALALGVGAIVGSLAGSTELGSKCAQLLLSLFI